MARKNKSNQLSREYLLRAFVSLMETEPYSSINITAITAAAGVSRMAYYRNYSAKEDILISYLDEISTAIARPMNDLLPAPKSRAEYIVLLFKRLCEDARVYGYNLGNSLAKAGLLDLFLFNVTKNLSSFFPPKNARDAVDASLIAGAFFGTYMQWSKDGQPDNVSLLADTLSEFITR